MKKKLISKTYLKGVTDWELIVKKQNQENYYLSIKKINEIDQPFIVDEDELIEALNEGKITKEEFDLAQKECAKLFQEIKENKNYFVNMNKKEMIKKYFNN